MDAFFGGDGHPKHAWMCRGQGNVFDGSASLETVWEGKETRTKIQRLVRLVGQLARTHPEKRANTPLDLRPGLLTWLWTWSGAFASLPTWQPLRPGIGPFASGPSCACSGRLHHDCPPKDLTKRNKNPPPLWVYPSYGSSLQAPGG